MNQAGFQGGGFGFRDLGFRVFQKSSPQDPPNKNTKRSFQEVQKLTGCPNGKGSLMWFVSVDHAFVGHTGADFARK